VYYSWSKEFSGGQQAVARRRHGARGHFRGGEVLRAEARQLKEALAEATLENRLRKKKRDRGWGGYCMRYPASQKLAIIHLFGRLSSTS
jgi:hypothetical protein